jgi:hypothetical protein
LARRTPAHQSDPPIPQRKAALKLVFATVIRAADRWCRVSINDLKRHQLKLLRVRAWTRPTPANTDNRKTNRHIHVA